MKKNNFTYCVFLAILACLSGCQDDLPVFASETTWLNFHIQPASDTTRYYSFIHAADPDAAVDTVWVETVISGATTEYDREVTIVQQVSADQSVLDAEPDVHYVSLTNPELKKHYILPANQHRVRLPIVVKQDESLQTADRVLRLEIVGNQHFKPGFMGKNWIKLIISNRFARPKNWNTLTDDDLGPYTSELHEFLVTVTEHRWDEDYLATLGYIVPIPYIPYPQFPDYIAYHNTNTSIYDEQYIRHILRQLKTKLTIDNQRRAAEGLPPWNITLR